MRLAVKPGGVMQQRSAVQRRAQGRTKERRLDIPLAVNGTLMRGLELNGNLLAAGARFLREASTVAEYRLWSIGDRHPAMPSPRALLLE